MRATSPRCARTTWRCATVASSRSRAACASCRPTSCCWRSGFVGPEQAPWLDSLGVDLDERGNVARDDAFMTNVPGVFVAGDMGRGQSLIVWAIAEGRACAAGVDRYLQGETTLPAPIAPTDRALM
ncbi:MAG: FAD-dependent oxidoreductase [Ilumatobacteraceae bacterium]